MTMYRTVWILALLAYAPTNALAQPLVVTRPVGTPVEHPLVASNPVRSSGTWRKGVEQFGENLVSESLQRRGFDVHNCKLPGNHGVDLVAIKRGPSGRIADIRLIEVKTHYGVGKPRLGQTQAGIQMSRLWLADRLRALRSAGAPGRKLALDIARFHKGRGLSVERLGEVHDINLRRGKYTIRNPVTMAERAGPMSIRRLLRKIAARSSQPAVKEWAVQHLARLHDVQQARMSRWLTASPSGRALDRVNAKQLALVEERQALQGARRGLARAAGRVALVVAIACDAYEIYGHVRDFRLGSRSQREFAVAMARSGGGIAGAWAGATGGAWAGAQIGLLGGPWAWVSVPAGGFVGGAVCGLAGYLAGSAAAETAAQAVYGALDQDARDEVSRWWKVTAWPFGG